MISAVESSVILDVLADSRVFADSSIAALRRGAREGKLIVCECVCAEVYPAIADRARFREFLSEWQLEFVPSTEESAVLAGEMFAAFLKRSRERKRVLADFLIAAHAIVHADRLIARDKGFFRDYFKDLPLLDPSSQ
jgi:predicted nucleic acid-binding protein